MPLNRPVALIGSTIHDPSREGPTDAAQAAKALAIGTRTELRFADKRIGVVLDAWFEPERP